MSDIESVNDTSDYEDDFDLEENVKSKTNNNAAQLGLIDCNIKEDDVLEVEDIILGGNYINKDIPKELLTCKICKKNDNIRLLLKSFLPVQEDSEYCLNSDDRWLYLIQCNSCINKDGSIRCIREIKYNDGQYTGKKEEEKENSIKEDIIPKVNPFAINNDTSANPFGNTGSSSNPFDNTQSNPFASTISTPVETIDNSASEAKAKMAEMENKKKHDLKPDLKVDLNEYYTPYFVYLDKEKFNKKQQPDNKKLNFDNIQIDDPSINLDDLKSTKDVKEVEVDPLVNELTTSLTDPQFNKFTNILEYNPDQILRLSDKPIFFKSDSFVKSYFSKKENKKCIPKLEGSSKERQFELQLMPYAISKLENGLDIDLKKVGMEWGTILVFTDPDSFTSKGRGKVNESSFIEEFVYVQWDD